MSLKRRNYIALVLLLVAAICWGFGQQLLAENPSRNLKEGAAVTRFAPSPTGFLHIGGVFTALAAERTAHTTGGKVILRIEDTDKKRQVEGGTALIKEGLQRFGVEFDEGAEADGSDKRDDAFHAGDRDLRIFHLAKDRVWFAGGPQILVTATQNGDIC